MGLNAERALASARLSVGRWTTEADIDAAADHLAEAAIRLTKPARHRTTASRRHTTTPAPRTP